jgi:hypothetical protein
MEIGRPKLPQRIFDRDHAKSLTLTAAKQIEPIVLSFSFLCSPPPFILVYFR